MTDWLSAFPKTLLFVCSGNHDWWIGEDGDADAEANWLVRARRRGVAVDGDVKIVRGRRFICTPWLSPVEVEGLEPVVLLAHAPPAGTKISRDRSGLDVGDFDLAQNAHELPPRSIVLSGHAHSAPQWVARLGATCCFNPGVDFTNPSVPNHVVIDTERWRAEFHGQTRAIRIVKL
jgi:hypothetical protein